MKNSLKKHFNKITRLQLLVIFIILGNLAMLIIYWDSMPWNNWSAQKIYKKYNSAVCLVHVKWGYRILIDGEDYTRRYMASWDINDSSICSIYLNAQNEVNCDYGENDYTATAFFIRNDGVLATNMHVVRPWFFQNIEAVKLFEDQLRHYFRNSVPDVDKLQVVGVIDSIWIVPNGKCDEPENGIPCKVIADVFYPDNEYAEKKTRCFNRMRYFYDNDVALIQTESEDTPWFVERIIDIDKSEGVFTLYNFSGMEKYEKDGLYSRIGEVVYAIGYPYGPLQTATLISDSTLSSQIQEGIITQYRGLLDFGHNIPVANGMSGSPIINRKGRLVGVHSSGFTGVTGVQGLNHGVSVNLIWNALRELDKCKKDSTYVPHRKIGGL